ncbi:MAG: histidinol dehydrogenase [Bacillota bacterium]
MIKQYKDETISLSEIFKREEDTTDVSLAVSEIILEVRKHGDSALKQYGKRFDSADLDVLELSQAEWDTAYESVDSEFLAILEEAKEHIEGYHKNQLRSGFRYEPRDGVILGQKIMPLERVGLYVPGGTATYPSSVLMNAIPAKLAGVEEIIMVTPAKNGKISPDVLAAAKIGGVDRIFKMGGAQAVAALAYGTESVPKVDKIVGPGNAFVAEAKRQVYGLVAIDMIAGPSEILVVADGESDPVVVAADLLSQAEHDKMASAVLVTESTDLAEAVSLELERQIPLLPREEIARASIDDNGKIILVQNIARAIEIANEIAPEHLEVCVDNPFDYLDDIRHAGSIFLGRNTPEAVGDYFSGTNHTLPTSGTARFSSPLSVDDFIKKSSYSYYSEDALEKEAEKINIFADREGLKAHGNSAIIRGERRNRK